MLCDRSRDFDRTEKLLKEEGMQDDESCLGNCTVTAFELLVALSCKHERTAVLHELC